jgi:hypothetical protein
VIRISGMSTDKLADGAKKEEERLGRVGVDAMSVTNQNCIITVSRFS